MPSHIKASTTLDLFKLPIKQQNQADFYTT